MQINPVRTKKFVIALACAAIPALLYAYAEGPDAGLAGVPGEGSCTACHSGGSGSGSVSVSFPNGMTYKPGVLQRLIVTITDSSQKRWGFQLTARQSSNAKTQAGSFTPGSDGYTQIVCTQATLQSEQFGNCPASMPLRYIEQTSSGTRNGTRGSITFAFDWTPPATDVGNVVVYVAGNAANGDGNTGGDHIYLKNYTLTSVPSNLPTVTSVVNAASFQAGISASSWVTILGSNLANTNRSWRGDEIVNGALPTQLDGVGVTINGNPAYVSFISPAQINVLAPADSSTGQVNVVVTNNGVASASVSAQLQSTSPAFFLWSGKYPVATRPDYSLVGPASLFPNTTIAPAKPGNIVILWGTGFGPTVPPMPTGQVVPSGQLASVANPPSVTIGNIAAQVIGAALSPGAAGLYQVVVQVPVSLSDGDQPIAVQSNGVQSSPGTFLTVQH